MGAVDLVIQVESPDQRRQRPAAGRPGRAPGRRAEPRRHLPQVPRRPARSGRRHGADARGRDRGDEAAAQPARRAGPAARRDDGPRALDGGRAVRDGAAGGAVREPDARRLRGRPGHAGRRVPLRRVRGAEGARRLGPRDGPCRGPARRPDGGDHERRHDPGPRARIPSSSSARRARRAGASASWTRRWSTRAASAR